MDRKVRCALVCAVIIAALLIVSCSSPESNPSPENKAPPLPASNSITLTKTTATDWTLDQGWSIVNANPLTFKGTGHTWLTLTKNLNGNSLMRFTLQRQKGDININIKNNLIESGLSRYILSIGGGKELFILKQQGNVENIQELMQVLLPAETNWRGTTAHVVEIKTAGPQTIVRVDGQRVLFFTDTQPLTTGTLAFETLEDSEFVVSDVQVTAGSEEIKEETMEQNSPADVSPTLESKTIPSEEIKPEDNLGFDLLPSKDSSGWTQTSGPLGGVVIRMIPHAGTIWASLYSGGIYELQPDNSWKQIAVGHGIPEVRAFDIVTDPNNVNIAYAPETITCGAKTINNGVSWQGLCGNMLKYIDSPNFDTNTLALDPTDSRILYVPGNMFDQTSVLLVSKDGGEQWEKRFTFDKHYDFNHLFFFNSKMYLATVNDGVFVSSDQGKSWKPFNKGLEEQTATSFVNFKNNLYLLTALRQHNIRWGGGLYRLTADGASWEKIPELTQVTGLATDDTTLYIGTWSPDPKLRISTDGNLFKEMASQGLPPGWLGEIVSLDSKIYVGVGGNGVFASSDNGNTFEEFNRGMISVATREVYVNPADENEIYVISGDRLGFHWSKNGGEGYRRLAIEYDVLTFQPDPHDFALVYIGGDRFAVGHVSKEGSKFTEKNRPGKDKTSFIKSLAIDPNNSNHILAGVSAQMREDPPGEGLWESHDQGQSWTRAQGIGNFAVYSIIFNPSDPNIVYASALASGVFKSTDGGSHFTPLGTDKLKYTYRLAMSPADPNTIVASSHLFFARLSSEEQISGKYGGIFQSKDGGTTWKEFTNGIRNYEGTGSDDFLPWLYNFGHLPNYENILIDPKNPDHLVVGHHGENVVETNDGGATWKKAGANEMVPGGVHNYAYCLGSSSNFKKFYACTCGRGLFRGLMNEKGYISSSLTGSAVYTNEDQHPQPRNAKEARELILSGEYNHQH